MKQLRLLLTALFLLMATWASANYVDATYTLVKETNVNGVSYRLYNVTAPWGYELEYTKNLDHVARITSLAGVSTSKFVIPEVVYEGGCSYLVEGISQYYDPSNNPTSLTSLTFEGSVGTEFIGKEVGQMYKGFSWNVTRWNVNKLIGEDDGVNFDLMRLSSLKELRIPSLNRQGTSDTWSFAGYSNLCDIYFTDCRPTLTTGMFTWASGITIHIPSEYITDNLQNSAVWCLFKAIVPYYSKFTATVVNQSSGLAWVNSLGTDNYSSDAPGWTDLSVSSQSTKSMEFSIGENYVVMAKYDNATCNKPTLTRNGATVTTFDIDDQTVAYQETNVQEAINYVVVNSYKQCRLSFQAGSAYVAGTYTVKSSGKTIKGNITSNRFIDCDYGSEVTLSMPATPYLLANSLKLTKYGSSTTTQNLSLPTPEEGNYTITFNVPEVNSARFNYSYIIPATVEEDPVITIIRMGEGEVKFKKFWDWRDQDDAYNTYQTVNCQQGKTQTTIPYPSTEGWGFTIEMTPLKGQTLRSFMLGYIMAADNGDGKDRIHWDDYLSTAQHNYNAETNTYTFTIDMMNGGGDNFDMTDYDILLDMGPEHTIIEDGNKQTFLRRGGTGQVYVNYEENAGDYDPEIGEGTTTITIPDYDSDNDCTYALLCIDKVRGEKFTAYRDGVDVTSQFTSTTSQYHYDFDSDDKQDNHRESSVWTLVFEKDESVTTSYDWTIMCAQGIEGNLISTYTAATMTDPINKSLRTYTINEANLQSVALSITAEEGMPLLFMCDGENVSSQATYDENTQAYTLTVPAMDMLNRTWYVGFDVASDFAAAIQWTVMQTNGIKGTTLTPYISGSSIESVSCDTTYQVIPIADENLTKVKLTIPSSTYQLCLNAFGSQKIKVVKVIQEIAGLGLKEAKDIADQVLSTESPDYPPVFVKTYQTQEAAEADAVKIAEAGGVASVRALCVLKDGVDVTSKLTIGESSSTIQVNAADVASSTWVITSNPVVNRFDTNGDFKITIADVTKLVNKVLGK